MENGKNIKINGNKVEIEVWYYFGLVLVILGWEIKKNSVNNNLDRVVILPDLSFGLWTLFWRRTWCTGWFWVGLSGRVSGARCSEVRDLT